MSTALVPSDPWIVRALRWARLLPAVDVAPPASPIGGLGGAPVQDTYALTAMSAWGRFSWVYRCATVIAQDVSSLPLYVTAWTPEPDGTDGPGRSVTTYRHAVLDLLRKPAPGVTGTIFRRQLAVDIVVAGNGYVRRVTVGGRSALVRLHPHSVRPIVDQTHGLIVGYEIMGLMGQAAQVPASTICHIRGPSWSDDVSQALGYSTVQALDSVLRTEDAREKQARTAAKRGRFDVLFSPESPDGYGTEAVKRLKDAYDEAAKRGDGAFFVQHGVKATPLVGSAKDAQSIEHRTADAIDVCAAFGVPPTIAGIPGANHGTAREEARGYWERTVMPLGTLIEDALTAYLLPNQDALTVGHDYSGVVALQVARMDQLAQAEKLVAAFGATPRAALDYLGFDDAPAGAAPISAPSARPGRDPAEEPRDEVFAASLLRASVGQPIDLVRHTLALLGYSGPVAEEAAHTLSAIPLDTSHSVRVALTRDVSRMLTASHEDAADA